VRADFEKLWSFSTGFYGVWIAFIGKRMGLLQSLSVRPMSSEMLASECALHPPAVSAWCSAASAYGLIRKRGEKYSLDGRMSAMLNDETHPDYLGGQYSYLALRSLEYGGFDQLFKSGRALPMSRSFEAIEDATHWDHYAVIRAIRRDARLHRLFNSGCKLLDIGCGTGSFLLKLLKEYPKSEYSGIDPSSKAVAKARTSLEGLPVKIRKIRAESLDMTEEFDVLYLGESLYASKKREVVLAKCFDALKKGGAILLVEGLLPNSKISNEDLIILGMQLDFALQGHSFMTKSELGKLLADAGFRKTTFSPLGGSVYLASARK
jgi:2-polyprenyl-3-methyl-5-hydroxy-6-metoxy-1,4-benzoquinol methylase